MGSDFRAALQDVYVRKRLFRFSGARKRRVADVRPVFCLSLRLCLGLQVPLLLRGGPDRGGEAAKCGDAGVNWLPRVVARALNESIFTVPGGTASSGCASGWLSGLQVWRLRTPHCLDPGP